MRNEKTLQIRGKEFASISEATRTNDQPQLTSVKTRNGKANELVASTLHAADRLRTHFYLFAKLSERAFSSPPRNSTKTRPIVSAFRQITDSHAARQIARSTHEATLFFFFISENNLLNGTNRGRFFDVHKKSFSECKNNIANKLQHCDRAEACKTNLTDVHISFSHFTSSLMFQ